MDHKEMEPLRQRDHFLEEGLLDDGGRGVVRVVEDEDFGPGKEALADANHVGQERLRVSHVEREMTLPDARAMA